MQRMVRLATMPLARRYQADHIYEKQRFRGKWFTNMLEGRVTSKDGNRYGQVFANHEYFSTVYPMDTKSKAGDALRMFCLEFGIPDKFTCYGSKEQLGKKTEFINHVRINDIKLHVIEPDWNNQIPCEGVISEVQ